MTYSGRWRRQATPSDPSARLGREELRDALGREVHDRGDVTDGELLGAQPGDGGPGCSRGCLLSLG